MGGCPAHGEHHAGDGSPKARSAPCVESSPCSTLVPTTRSRHDLTATISSWGLDEVAYSAVRDVAELLTSELVTNAVRHAHSDVAVTIGLAGEVLEVGVSDADHRSAGRVEQVRSRLSRDPGHGTLVEGGRGLHLLEALSQAWGVTSLPEGKQVWFTLPVPGWPPAGDCPCQGTQLDTIVLGSGRRVVHLLSG